LLKYKVTEGGKQPTNRHSRNKWLKHTPPTPLIAHLQFTKGDQPEGKLTNRQLLAELTSSKERELKMITYELYAWKNEKRGDDAEYELVSETTSKNKLKRDIKFYQITGVKLKDIMVFEGDEDDTHANYRKTLDLELNDKGY
jgi:hypothetical protein